jgi:integrase
MNQGLGQVLQVRTSAVCHFLCHFPAQTMSQQTGLFLRNGTFYLRFIIPQRQRHLFDGRSRIVRSLHTTSKREANAQALALRAQLLSPEVSNHLLIGSKKTAQDPKPIYTVRSLLSEWKTTKKPSQDTFRACELAVEGLMAMLEVPDMDLSDLSRKFGQQYSAHLVERCKSRKTAHGKLTWIKSLLNFASDDLELIPRNPWRGIEVRYSQASNRRNWSDSEISTLLSALKSPNKSPLTRHVGAGAEAAYWLPMLAMYTGARLSELAQLTPSDLVEEPDGYWLNITDKAEHQKLKSVAAKRKIPIHQALVDAGFLSYAMAQAKAGHENMWPLLPMRQDKAGGYFSNWFGRYLKSLGMTDLDFHSFRHTFRSKLVMANVPEAVIDQIMGHSVSHNVGKARYTHVASALRSSIGSIYYLNSK